MKQLIRITRLSLMDGCGHLTQKLHTHFWVSIPYSAAGGGSSMANPLASNS